MSLSQLIKNNPAIKKNIPMLKPYLRDLDGNAIDWRTKIKVPIIGESFERGLLGTTFDYVARAILYKKLGRENVTPEKILIAEKGLAAFAHSVRSGIFVPLTKNPVVNEERANGQIISSKNFKEIRRYLKKEYDLAVKTRERFIDGKEAIENLIEKSIFLARLDEPYRNPSYHIADEYFKATNQKTYFSQLITLKNDQIKDNITQMAAIFQENINPIRWKSVILNPEFGKYSNMVSGADADIIVDDMLVDIKTKDKFTYKGDYFAQLLGCAAFAIALGQNVKKVAIYYARYGQFVSFDLNDPVLGRNFLDKYLREIKLCQRNYDKKIFPSLMGLPKLDDNFSSDQKKDAEADSSKI